MTRGGCVLVGHSYGGMIITETGTYPDVKALVYVAAMQPDDGESLSDLAGKMPAAAQSIKARWGFDLKPSRFSA